MGNKNSLIEIKGSLRITLEQLTCEPGQFLNGKIHYDFPEPIPSNKLIVQLNGERRITSNGSYGYYSHRSEIIQPALRYEFSTTNEEDYQGQGSFDFAFYLPEGIPASFFYLGNRGTEVFITYTVTVSVEYYSDEATQKYQPMVKKRVAVILSKEKGQYNDVQRNAQYKIKNTQTLYGDTHLYFHMNKNYYNIDEQIHISSQLEALNCTCDIKEIDLSLYRIVKVFEGSTMKYKDKALLLTEKMSGVSAGAFSQQELKLKLSKINTYPASIYGPRLISNFKKINENFSKNLGHHLTDLQASLDDEQIKCKYKLEAKVIPQIENAKSLKPIKIEIIIHHFYDSQKGNNEEEKKSDGNSLLVQQQNRNHSYNEEVKQRELQDQQIIHKDPQSQQQIFNNRILHQADEEQKQLPLQNDIELQQELPLHKFLSQQYKSEAHKSKLNRGFSFFDEVEEYHNLLRESEKFERQRLRAISQQAISLEDMNFIEEFKKKVTEEVQKDQETTKGGGCNFQKN